MLILFAMALAGTPMAAGVGHTCIAVEGKPVCWGGLTPAERKAGEEPRKPRVIQGVAGISDLSVGSSMQACAVAAGGAVLCWGPDGIAQQKPEMVATDVAVGEAHGCAVLQDRTVSCWGYNARGQLGDGTNVTRDEPKRVPGVTDAVSIAAGQYHTCAVRDSGHVLCWGADGEGQLGDGDTGLFDPTPREVLYARDVLEVTAGAQHTCARRSTGDVICWGGNLSGQLGDGSRAASAAPVFVRGVSDVIALDAGLDSNCAAQRDGRLKCWGANDRFQLGSNTTQDHLFAGANRTLKGVTNVTVGANHTCAQAEGKLFCFGGNSQGELADGTRESRAEPAQPALP